MARTAVAVAEDHSLHLRYMPSLDSLRGAAVLMVVLFHGFASYGWRHRFGDVWGALAATTVGCGRFGVNVFFVLSGFLITGILLAHRESPTYYSGFYLRRILRIVPVYLVVIAVLFELHQIDVRFAIAAILFLANFSRIFGAPLTEYGALWSLAVEEHFYLLWPLCVHRFRARSLHVILWALILGEPLLRLLAALVSPHTDIHYKTPFVLDFLAYGALLSMLVRSRRIHPGNAPGIAKALVITGAALAIAVIYLGSFHNTPALDALADLPFTWAACGVLLLGLVRDHRVALQTGRTSPAGLFSFYGYISYGLYLIHVEVYTLAKAFVLRHFRPELLNQLAFFSLAILVCILVATALAFLSRRYFEGPILHLKERFTGRAVTSTRSKPAPSPSG